MTDTTPYRQGEFCWAELHTHDAAKAKDFYGKLLGWTMQDDPLPGGGADDGVYTTASVAAGPVAGIYEMSGEEMAGVPSHWTGYVWVDDVAASMAKAKELGGTALMDAMDMPGIGSMAMIQDKAGAVLGLFHGTGHKGFARLDGKPGGFSWFELMTNDQAAAEPYYSKLLGWGLGGMDMGDGMKYTLFKVGEDQVAGGMEMFGEQMAGIPPNWGGFITVADVDASAAKAVELGGTQAVAPTDIPNIGRFAVITDPTGATVSIIKYLPRTE